MSEALVGFSFGSIKQCFYFPRLAFCIFALSEMLQYNSGKPSVNQNSFYQPSLCRTACWVLGTLSDVSHLWPPVFPEHRQQSLWLPRRQKLFLSDQLEKLANISKPDVKKMKLNLLLAGFPFQSWGFFSSKNPLGLSVPVQAQIPALSVT